MATPKINQDRHKLPLIFSSQALLGHWPLSLILDCIRKVMRLSRAPFWLVDHLLLSWGMLASDWLWRQRDVNPPHRICSLQYYLQRSLLSTSVSGQNPWFTTDKWQTRSATGFLWSRRLHGNTTKMHRWVRTNKNAREWSYAWSHEI